MTGGLARRRDAVGLVPLALHRWHCAVGIALLVLRRWHCAVGIVPLVLCRWYCAVGIVPVLWPAAVAAERRGLMSCLPLGALAGCCWRCSGQPVRPADRGAPAVAAPPGGVMRERCAGRWDAGRWLFALAAPARARAGGLTTGSGGGRAGWCRGWPVTVGGVAWNPGHGVRVWSSTARQSEGDDNGYKHE